MDNDTINRIEAHAALCLAALVHRRGIGTDPSNERLAKSALEAATELVALIDGQRQAIHAEKLSDLEHVLNLLKATQDPNKRLRKLAELFANAATRKTPEAEEPAQ